MNEEELKADWERLEKLINDTYEKQREVELELRKCSVKIALENIHLVRWKYSSPYGYTQCYVYLQGILVHHYKPEVLFNLTKWNHDAIPFDDDGNAELHFSDGEIALEFKDPETAKYYIEKYKLDVDFSGVDSYIIKTEELLTNLKSLLNGVRERNE